MKVTSHPAGEAGSFAFTAENEARAGQIIARYPEGRQASAVIALLDLAQRQNGNWLSAEAIEYVANKLDMAPIRVHEVVSFYTMFNQKPVGKHFIQVCRTTPCWLRGSDDLTGTCLSKLGTKLGETSDDGLFTVVEVECLGACANAPMVQINDLYYEDLTPERMAGIIDDLKDGKEIPLGSQTGRQGSSPNGAAAAGVAAVVEEALVVSEDDGAEAALAVADAAVADDGAEPAAEEAAAAGDDALPTDAAAEEGVAGADEPSGVDSGMVTADSPAEKDAAVDAPEVAADEDTAATAPRATDKEA